MVFIDLFCFTLLLVTIFSTVVAGSEAEEEAPSPPVTLTIGLGDIKGTVEKSRGGRAFYQFRGISYGEVPQRFMESLPVTKKWDGVKDATEFGSICLQAGNGDEDCLHLNVYTPFLPKDRNNPMAVLLFIHGGAFIIGSGNLYGAQYWMDEDIVIVTINYRLSAFGFFNLGIDQAPGNQGLKDQILAFKWVQENIGYFNGDKNRVTIFGESAGAGSVSYQLLTPLSKGLIHGGISQSGTAVCPWAVSRHPLEQSMILARKLKCAMPKAEDTLDCLVKKDHFEISEVLRYDVVPKERGNENPKEMLTALSFIPSVEERAPSVESTIFLNKPAIEILKAREFQGVPWIVGINHIEGFLFQNGLNLKNAHTKVDIAAGFSKLGPSAFNYGDRPLAEKNAITENIRKFYFDERTDIKENITNLCSDRMFFYCTKVAAELYSQTSPVYLYHLEKVGAFSVMSHFMGGEKPPGPTHADELTYQWQFISPFLDNSLSDIEPGHALYNFSRDLVSMWASFAQNGKPKNTWNSKAINWEPVSKTDFEHQKWLTLQDDAVLEEEPENIKKRMKFWRENEVKF